MDEQLATFSIHARAMLTERKIEEEWVWRTINEFDKKETRIDGNFHFFKRISENGGRILHVIMNPLASPMKIFTIYFDRHERKT